MAAVPKEKPPTRIFLVDDHAVVRYALAQLIGKQTDMMVCGEAEDSATALRLIPNARPDLVIGDVSLRECSGIELIRNLKVQFPNLPVLVVSMHDEMVFAEVALRAGAVGYIMKEEAIDKVLIAIRETLNGTIYVSSALAARMIRSQAHGQTKDSPMRKLSDRQLEVFRLIGQWKGTGEIAKELHLSVKTVDYYREQIKMKLHLRNAAELLQCATHLPQ